MSRGKFSKQSWHQRAIDAEARVRDLEKMLHHEVRAHAATRITAERVKALNRRITDLELDLAAATGDEVRRLEELVGQLQEQLATMEVTV